VGSPLAPDGCSRRRRSRVRRSILSLASPPDPCHGRTGGSGGLVASAGEDSTGNLTLISDLLAEHSAASVRLLLLDRPWQQSWQYEPAGLDEAAGRLYALYAAAGRPAASTAASTAVTAALLNDLDVPRAVDIALEDGGDAARLLVRVLSLS
jgi:hypothetical protein